MLGRLIRGLFVIAVVAGLAWVGRRALIRWIDGPAQEPSRAPWPPVAAPPSEPVAAAPSQPVAAAPSEAMKTTAEVLWVPGEGGACPGTHPVKAKLSSRLYHLPGMAAYARTTPDRCYRSAEAAETDGFKRAKR